MKDYDWKKHMYLVAIPSGELFEEAVRIQKLLSDSLKVYKEASPPIHITISTVKMLEKKEELMIFDRCVKNVLADYNPIKIVSYCFDCFTKPHNSLILKIEDDQRLRQLQKSLEQALDNQGFLVPPSVDKWIFHITILSEIFANISLKKDEFLKVCQRLSLKETPIRGVIERLELWKPELEKEKRVASKYILDQN